MPTTFTTTLPAATSVSASVDVDAKEIDLSWQPQDDNPTGDQDVERRRDGGSWTTVASVGVNDGSYTDTTATVAETYQYRIERNTDDATTTSGTTNDQRIPKRLSRTAMVRADGQTHATRSGSTKKRDAAVSADGSLSTSRAKTQPRLAVVRGNGKITVSRGATDKQRSSTVTADAQTHTRAEFTEVFPSEQTEALDWDFSFGAPFGFVSEWFEETHDLGIEIDAFTVVVDSAVFRGYELGIEYDVDGDGTAEHRTETQSVVRDGQTLTFPNIGAEGQYRLYIQQMRSEDYLRAVTVGPTRY